MRRKSAWKEPENNKNVYQKSLFVMNRLFVISGGSIVFSGNFKVALGMIADGADVGSLGAHHDVAVGQ